MMRIKLNYRIYSWIILLAATLTYTITAYNSHGFYHADEHYQIIEFAGSKLGTHSADDLAWEYHYQLRSSIQPVLCIFIFKLLHLFGIHDPYSLAFALRLLTAFFSLFIITLFIRRTSHYFQNETSKLTYQLIFYFLWFIPFLSARFSSETWSGMLLLLALSILINKKTNSYQSYIFGFALGLCFLFRYQMAIAIAGMMLWLILIEKKQIAFLLKTSSTFLLVLIIGVILDFWFYGSFVLTSWNYFYAAIIEGSDSSFGVEPWYYYFEKLFSYSGFFLGLIISISLLICLWFIPKNIFLWCIIPFIAVHCLIPHKEERFLFPIVFLFPVMIMLGINELKRFSRFAIGSFLFKLILLLFILLNFIGIVAMASKSAGYGRMEISRYLHQKHKNQNIQLIYTFGANPYDPFHSLPVKFYAENQMQQMSISNLCELEENSMNSTNFQYLVVRKFDLQNDSCNGSIAQLNFEEVKRSVPKWIEELNRFYKGLRDENIIILYQRKQN